MGFVVSMLMETAAIPIVVAVVVAGLANRFPRLQHCATTLGVACGFIAGWYSQDWTVWWPQRYLDWMPAAALLLLVAPWVAPALASWLLVPPFASLQPSRPTAIGLVAFATYCGGLLLEKAAKKSNQRLLIGVLLATGTACAVVLGQSFSLKFPQIAGLLTAALTAGLLWTNSPDGNVAGLPMLFYGVMANLMFIGYANTSSNVPTVCFGLPLLAPLVLLWNPSTGPQRKARLAAVAAVLLLALVPAILAHPPWETEL